MTALPIINVEAATIAWNFEIVVPVSTLGCVVSISYRVNGPNVDTMILKSPLKQCRKMVFRIEPSLLPSCKQKQAMVMMKSAAVHLKAFLRGRAVSIVFDWLLHTR
jgi:hypothetical protein